MARSGHVSAILLSAAAVVSSCRAHGVIRVDPFPPGERALGPEVALVVWNVRKGLDARLRDDLREIALVEDPDLLLVQEGRADLHPSDRLGGVFGKSWRFPWSRKAAEGVGSFSRVPPERVELAPSRWREFFVTAPKASLVTSYPLNDGRKLLVANVHLLAFERWGTMRLQDQLEDLHERIDGHDGPVLLTGDFNTWSAKRLALVEELARNLCLEEVQSFPAGRMTGDKGWKHLNWLLGIDPSLPLDRVYVRGLTPLRAEVLGAWRSSDHVGISALFHVDSFLGSSGLVEAAGAGG